MTLRQKQSEFARLLGLLIAFVFSHATWEVTLGDGHVSCGHGHMPGSLHYKRLAQDLNLFIEGRYVANGADPAWRTIGEFWEGLSDLARWGGRFNDANHFSFAHGGKA